MFIFINFEAKQHKVMAPELIKSIWQLTAANSLVREQYILCYRNWRIIIIIIIIRRRIPLLQGYLILL